MQSAFSADSAISEYADKTAFAANAEFADIAYFYLNRFLGSKSAISEKAEISAFA